MSWLFSQALVEEYSAGTSLAGAPSAQLNVTPTQHKFWRNDKTMDASDLSRFGLTLRLLTVAHGVELLTSFLAAFPAKTSAQQEPAPALMDSAADSGHTWRASFARYSPDSSTWKTAQCSLLADSDEFSETWPRWGSMRNGVSFLRPIPALPICESESGLWQTPVADDAIERKAGKWNSRGEPKLSAEVKLYPTPTVGSKKCAGTLQEWGGSGARKKMKEMMSAEELTGQLNPAWVEWLMGWPTEWTALKPLATAKFREWQQQHGICSAEPTTCTKQAA